MARITRFLLFILTLFSTFIDSSVKKVFLKIIGILLVFQNLQEDNQTFKTAASIVKHKTQCFRRYLKVITDCLIRPYICKGP